MSKLIAVVLALAAVAQAPPPATEVFLADLKVERDAVRLGEPVNITRNPGYDNQPFFTPDGRAVLFTSVRGERTPDPANSAAIGSDIYRYDIPTRQIVQVTSTPESEYSPTVTPDGGHISVIRVEGDGTQRLWRFSLDGKNAEVVLTDIKPVGYHAWVDRDTVALFVLGQPATLQLADVRTGKAEVMARGVGRSIQRIPDGGVSFVQREIEGKAAIVMELAPASRQTTPLVTVPQATVQPDLAWTPDGMLLMATGGKLYFWRRGQAQMTAGADLDALGLRGVTRLAVSPRGDRIALVAQP
jgi:hypothetical protein